MKTYLSGPITGDPRARAKFAEAASILKRQLGDEVIDPHNVPACAGSWCTQVFDPVSGEGVHEWECYLRHDLRVMLECDRVVALPGFQLSRRARLETFVAGQVGIPIVLWSQLFKWDLT